MFACKLKWQRRSVQGNVLTACEIQVVLADFVSNESWLYLLFLLRLSSELRNG